MYNDYHMLGPKLNPKYDYWFRAETKTYACSDGYDDDCDWSFYTRINIEPFIVVRTTPKGVFVRPFLGSEIFVLGTAKKQLCVPTIEAALHDLVQRKKLHTKFSYLRYESAKKTLNMAQDTLNEVKRKNHATI